MQDLDPSAYTGEHFHSMPLGAKNGEKRGLKMILDVETFDYAYFPRASGGLKISLADARDKAVINQDGSYLSPGEIIQTFNLIIDITQLPQFLAVLMNGVTTQVLSIKNVEFHLNSSHS